MNEGVQEGGSALSSFSLSRTHGRAKEDAAKTSLTWIGFAFDLSYQVAHRDAHGSGKLLNDEDCRHPLSPLQQADVIAMHARLGRKSLLGETGGFTLTPEYRTESSVE
jgi:hypothetical protein